MPNNMPFDSAAAGLLQAVVNDFDYEFCNQWWARLLADEEAMNKWLCKLWRTEKGGWEDNMGATEKFATPGSREDHIFRATGRDELNHAALLIEALKGRGITPIEEEQPPSVYWAHMNQYINDLQSCAAVFAIGEKLAAVRFGVIHDHPGTPTDITKFLNRALPEETYHATAFAGMSDADNMRVAYEQHKIASSHLRSGPTLIVPSVPGVKAPSPFSRG